MIRIVAILLMLMLGLGIADAAYSKDQSGSLVRKATKAFRRNQPEEMRQLIVRALDESKGPERVAKLFVKKPEIRAAFVGAMETEIDQAAAVTSLHRIDLELDEIAASRVWDAATDASVRERIGHRVETGNRDGSLHFLLDHYSSRWPVLSESEHQQLLVDRSISELQQGSERPVEGLMTYAASAESNEKQRIRELLSSFRLRAGEMPNVEIAFPGFSGAYLATITERAVLETLNADRIFEIDLLKHLRSTVRGVEWLDAAKDGSLIVRVERVRHDERPVPEQTQTITYAQHQVNLLGAVLLMPQNASYLFDQVTSGGAIEYGYVITVRTGDTAIHEEIVRGTESQTAVRCQNARIVNVFGGVQPASFVANTDMQQRCSGSQNSFSLDGVRTLVLDHIRDGLLKAAPIARVHGLN